MTLNQKKVIKKTLEKIGKNGLLNKGNILKEIGYSKHNQDNPKNIYDSKGVKEGLEPLTDGLRSEINKIQKEMELRDITQEKYKELGEVQDKKIKNYQLLSGGITDRTEVIDISAEELADYEEWRKQK